MDGDGCEECPAASVRADAVHLSVDARAYPFVVLLGVQFAAGHQAHGQEAVAGLVGRLLVGLVPQPEALSLVEAYTAAGQVVVGHLHLQHQWAGGEVGAQPFDDPGAVAPVAPGGVDGEVLAVAKGAEVPVGEEPNGCVVAVQDDVVVESRLRVRVEAQLLQRPVLLRWEGLYHQSFHEPIPVGIGSRDTLQSNHVYAMFKVRLLFRIKLNQPAQGPLADGAEGRILVRAHAAVVRGAVQPPGRVGRPFVQAHLVHVEVVGWRGQRRALGNHVLPLRGEVHARRHVLFPRLHVGRIRIVHDIFVVEILVGQSPEAVSELMHHHRAEVLVVRRGQRVRIVDASAAIFVRVGQHDDVLIVYPRQCVVQGLEVRGGQVAVGVERAEVRAEGRAAPLAQPRDAHPAVCRRAGHCHDVEPLLHRAERLVVEQAFAGCLRVAVEHVHLPLRVAFGHDGHVDAAVGRSVFQQVAVWADMGFSLAPYQYVVRVDTVLQPGTYLSVRVEQRDFYLRRPPGEGQQEGVFEALGRDACFVRLQPFLEECGERRAVDDRAVCCVLHRDLPVAGQWQFRQVVVPSGPAGQCGEFVHADGLPFGIACEQVVDTQRPVGEILFECLCLRYRQAEA